MYSSYKQHAFLTYIHACGAFPHVNEMLNTSTAPVAILEHAHVKLGQQGLVTSVVGKGACHL